MGLCLFPPHTPTPTRAGVFPFYFSVQTCLKNVQFDTLTLTDVVFPKGFEFGGVTSQEGKDKFVLASRATGAPPRKMELLAVRKEQQGRLFILIFFFFCFLSSPRWLAFCCPFGFLKDEWLCSDLLFLDSC